MHDIIEKRFLLTINIITPDVKEKRITFLFIGTYGSCFLVTGFNLEYSWKHKMFT